MIKALVAPLLCSLTMFFCAAQALAQTPPPAPAASVPAHDPKYGVYPIAYREIITRWLEKRLVDAASAKLEFTEPTPVEVAAKGGQTFAGYAVEFRVNSRNRFGTYTGFQRHRVLIRNGDILSANRAKN